MTEQSSDGGSVAVADYPNSAPTVFVASPDGGARGLRLAARLDQDDVQQSLRLAATQVLNPGSGESHAGKATSGEEYPGANSSSPPSADTQWGSGWGQDSQSGGWGDAPAPIIVVDSSHGEVSSAYFQPWLPLGDASPPVRLMHRLYRETALLPPACVLVGFGAAQFAANPTILTTWLVSDALAAPTLPELDAAQLRLYIQLGVFSVAAVLVFVAFAWSLFAAASQKPRTAAFGTKVFSQVLTFMVGALTGFLAT